jgi:circadian clock protein KaiC
MFSGKGVFRGSSVLMSGTAGTGKTSIAAHFAAAACGRGENCLFFSFEESQAQLIRNMRSIGLDLEQWIKRGLLRIHSERPTRFGLEMHLALLHRMAVEFRPSIVVVDPISSFIAAGSPAHAGTMLIRLIDFLKTEGITTVFTNLTQGAEALENTDIGISSIIDTWLLLRDTEQQGRRAGVLYVLKSRGMSHSKEMRGYRITDHGIMPDREPNGVPVAPTKARAKRRGKRRTAT